MSKHTPGPWFIDEYRIRCAVNQFCVCTVTAPDHRLRGKDWHEEHDICASNARLISAAPDQHAEMLRYLPVLERAYADGELWDRLTEGLGIATLNGYRAAIAKATGEQA